MNELANLLAYLLSSMGLTVLIVWPETGPSAWLREKVARRLLPGRAQEVLDCYVCCGFWTGLLVAAGWWFLYRAYWYWFGCLMVPALFWLALGPADRIEGDDDEAP
jgi:hypothetical protein